LSQEEILKTLIGFGLSRLDSDIYLFIAKKGLVKASDITKGLNTQKQPLYRSLKNLQSKGIVTATLERPARFAAVPFDKVVDVFIRSKMAEAQRLQENKDQILAHWQDIAVNETADESSKFNIIEGRGPIYAKSLQMMQDAQNQLSIIFTIQSLLRADQFGLFDEENATQIKPTAHFRILTELNKQNFSLVNNLIRELAKSKIVFEGKVSNSELTLPQLIIRDEEEILFFIKHQTNGSQTDQDNLCLWTNCKSLAQAMTAFFEDFWHNSTEISSRITEIENGHATPNTINVKDHAPLPKKDGEKNSARPEIALPEFQIPRIKRNGKRPSRKTLAFLSIILVVSVLGVTLAVSFQHAILPQTVSTPPTSPLPTPLSINSVFYDTPQVSTNGTEISVPASFVEEHIIVNVDLELQAPVTVLSVGARNITLSFYRGGNYLPLMIIMMPKQHVVAALRVCEPCHTFNFNIVNGELQCDSVCESTWDPETLIGIHGWCSSVSPLAVPASIVGGNVVIDISSLQVKVVP